MKVTKPVEELAKDKPGGIDIAAGITKLHKEHPDRNKSNLVEMRVSTNDFMSATPGHPILLEALVKIFKNYEKFDFVSSDGEPYQEGEKPQSHYQNLMDQKRHYLSERSKTYRFKEQSDGRYFSLEEGQDRRSLTLRASCSPILRAAEQYSKQSTIKVEELFTRRVPQILSSAEPPFFLEAGCQVSGIMASHGADQNWLKKPKRDPMSYDDSELYSASIRWLKRR